MNHAERCPVCNGRGVVKPGFYNLGDTTSLAIETCRSCGGKGYIIVPDKELPTHIKLWEGNEEVTKE